MDPKLNITNQHVNNANVITLFGALMPLKSTSMNLPNENKIGLHSLFWRVNGHSHISNNEYMLNLLRDGMLKKKVFK